ncbi:Uncharacterised protein [Mycobacteroides abscessus subsp. abscessus]|nr:Uncharacterised protein [Mycobacteroides abscessus subsp. abscessus]
MREIDTEAVDHTEPRSLTDDDDQRPVPPLLGDMVPQRYPSLRCDHRRGQRVRVSQPQGELAQERNTVAHQGSG